MDRIIDQNLELLRKFVGFLKKRSSESRTIFHAIYRRLNRYLKKVVYKKITLTE